MDTTELQRFVEHTNKTLSIARTPADIPQQIFNLISDLGFSDFDYSHVVGQRAFGFTSTSLPETLVNSYNAESLHQHDIALEYVLANDIPIYQSTLNHYITQSPFNLERNQKNLSITNLMSSYGYHEIYIIPLKLDNTAGKISFSLLSKNAKANNFRTHIEDTRAKLHQLGYNICNFVSREFPCLLPANSNNGRPTLTRRQAQVLETLARRAKTSQQVADHLHISVRTVNKHIEEAKESLGAFSTANAIYLAIERKLISMGR